MPKKFLILITLILFTGTSPAQITFKVVDKKTINLDDQYLIAPQWSPDGNFIAAAGNNYGSIWIYNIKMNKWKKLIEQNGAGWDFDWSPDSKKIAFRANIFNNRRKQTIIKYVDIATGKVRKVVAYNRNFSTPKWITDEWLAFLHNDEFKTVSIANNNMTSSALNVPQKNICLLSNAGVYIKKSNQAVKPLDSVKGQIFNVSFSPDGKTILFKRPGRKIFTLKENTTKAKLIAEGEMPCWSPSGKFIVFSKTKEDGYKYLSSDIFICDSEGGNERQITRSKDELEMRPDWSPDGKKIACDSNGKIILINLETE